MAISQNFPSEGPNLYVNFAGSKTLDSRINLSRASTGTYVDADGLIKTAAINRPRFNYNFATGQLEGLLAEPSRTNKWLFSDVWGNGSSGNDGNYVPATIGYVNIIRNYGVAPNGVHNSIAIPSGGQLVLQGTTNSSGFVTLSFFAKKYLSNSSFTVGKWTGMDTNFTFNFDTETLTFAYSPQRVFWGFTKLPNGWYRIYVTFNTIIAPNENSVWPTISSPVELWGVQIESSAFPSSYIPSPITFTSRASSATFYDSTGIIRTAATNIARNQAFIPDSSGVFRSAGVLLEPSITNLVTYSEDFANWFLQGVTISSNVTTAPDGTSNADKIIPDTTTSLKNTVHLSSKGSGTFTFSVYAKAAGYPRLGLRVYDGTLYRIRVTFDISNGTVASLEAGIATITPVGNGWYRCSCTGTSPSGDMGATAGWVIESLPNGLTVQTAFAGDGTSGAFVWGAQIEQSSYASSYIQTVASNVTRAADVASSSAVTRSADVVTLSGTSSIVNSSGGTLLSLSNQISPVIDTTSLSINSTSLSTSRPVREILYYPTVLTSTTIKQMKAFPSFVTNGLQLHLDAGNTSSYSGSGSTWTDLSGNGRNFTLVNSSYYAFDSANEGSIRLTRTLPPTAETGGYAEHTGSGALAVTTYLYNNHTTEIWARINDRNPTNHTVNETQSVLFVYRGWHSMFYYGSSALTYTVYDGTTPRDAVGLSIGTSGTDIIQGTWFNVVVTRNGNIFSTYINGVLKGSITLTTSSSGVNTTNSIRIGMANPSGEDFSWHADANVSCARMYNIALTASEVQQNFNALRGRYGI